MPPREGMSGPHLSGAFLCEKALNEKDGVPSFIRVVERFTVHIIPPELQSQLPPNVVIPPKLIQFMLVVMLKAGDLPIGRYTMRVILVKPDGAELNSQDFSVFFNGSDDHGVTIIAPMAVPEPEEGLHWFDVHFDGARITRIPLRVIYQNIQFMPGLPPG